MCIINNKAQLDKFRAKKRPIIGWKKGHINPKTGLVITTGFGFPVKGKAVWKKGTTVKPHRIHKPLGDKCPSTAGLYFYTDEEKIEYAARYSNVGAVKAKICPKDIIAVSDDGKTFCANEAFVLDAPNPNPDEMRTKYLKKRITLARNERNVRKSVIKDWTEEHDAKEEALQQMVDEVEQLKPKSRTKPQKTRK